MRVLRKDPEFNRRRLHALRRKGPEPVLDTTTLT
jgi:hypothetical protein